jgi:hypothetical protein
MDVRSVIFEHMENGADMDVEQARGRSVLLDTTTQLPTSVQRVRCLQP